MSKDLVVGDGWWRMVVVGVVVVGWWVVGGVQWWVGVVSLGPMEPAPLATVLVDRVEGRVPRPLHRRGARDSSVAALLAHELVPVHPVAHHARVLHALHLVGPLLL